MGGQPHQLALIPDELRNVTRVALFSMCKTWRYRLIRAWEVKAPKAVWIMLNPSIANGERDDPTTTQNVRRMEALGYGRYEAVNLFAAVGTDPKILPTMPDPVGPDNDDAIMTAIADADLIVVAWGRGGALQGRCAGVLAMLRGVDLWCLGVNQDGSPRFPRAIPSDKALELYRPAEAH